MPLPTRVRTRLIDAINVMFKNVGLVYTPRQATTAHNAFLDAMKTVAFPKDDNRAPVAFEYWLAHHVMGQAKGRYEEARHNAVRAGIIFDHTEHPRPSGTNELTYHDDNVAVWLSVKNAAKQINAQRMREYLAEKGVKPALLDEAMEHATSYNKPAHVFNVSLAVASD